MVLWRNTIQLFHSYRRPRFEGPFKEAGFAEYRIDEKFLTSGGEEKSPDIVTGADGGWAVLELSTDGASKAAKLDTYKTIDPRQLGAKGLSRHTAPPDTLSSRLAQVDDGNHCELLVATQLAVAKEDRLANDQLRRSLIKNRGADLTHLPQLPIAFVPEAEGQEIRQGLADLVLQLFAPGARGLTTYELANKGLERLADLVPQGPKKGLMTKIEREMDILAGKHLKGLLEKRAKQYQVSDKWRRHPKSLEYVASRVQEWAGRSTITTLRDFQ